MRLLNFTTLLALCALGVAPSSFADSVEQDPVKETKQEVKPKLNFIELEGGFRVRSDFFHRCDLGTFIPNAGPGTSNCPPPIGYFNPPGVAADNGGDAVASPSRPHSIFSTNMRLRLQPTLNVSEDIRIKSTIDVLDNLVLGSTPNYMARYAGGPSPTYPIALTSLSQNEPLVGINSFYGSLAVKRLWGELTLPFGELRFGRMPFNFGMGMLYNSGNQIDDDYGDTIDGLLLATRVFGHYLIPGYSIALSGPHARGGGSGIGGDHGIPYFPGELGQRMDLDPTDNIHTFLLTFAKKDSDEEIKTRLSEGDVVINYGVLASYRFQINDSQYATVSNANGAKLRENLVARNAHLGIGSLWASLYWNTFQIEVEAAGTLGRIGRTTGDAFRWADNKAHPLWLLQGGAALRSRYGLFNDRLGIGFDTGIASGGKNPGFGLRPGLNPNAKDGAFDGPQFGPPSNTEFDTHFRFNPDYHVDLLLFREILGTVTNALYLRPHVGYDITDSLGVRGDLIASFATSAKGTPGGSNLLGVELDASAFYRTDDGFFCMLQYGVLVPLAGLNHRKEALVERFPTDGQAYYATYGTARIAQTLQLFLGIEF